MIQLKIKEVASQRGMSLKEVCEKAGYKSLPSFYRQINNPDSINMKTLIRIADVIGCSVNDFFVDKEERDENIILCPHCGKPIRFDKDYDEREMFIATSRHNAAKMIRGED